MKEKIYRMIVLVCSGLALLFAFIFFMRAKPIAVEAPLLTKQMVEEYQTQQQQAIQKQKQSEAARKRADLEARMVSCQKDEECIIVDKDPCGCLKGPDSITAINSNFALEFSAMVEKRFATATACPSVGSAERECSASARPICQERRCKIVY